MNELIRDGKYYPWCQARVSPLKGERRCHHKQFVTVFKWVDIANHETIKQPVYLAVKRQALCQAHYEKLNQYGDANLNIGKLTGLMRIP